MLERSVGLLRPTGESLAHKSIIRPTAISVQMPPAMLRNTSAGTKFRTKGRIPSKAATANGPTNPARSQPQRTSEAWVEAKRGLFLPGKSYVLCKKTNEPVPVTPGKAVRQGRILSCTARGPVASQQVLPEKRPRTTIDWPPRPIPRNLPLSCEAAQARVNREDIRPGCQQASRAHG